jgi:cytochrome oxidase assembly protein ShyY1
MAGTRSRRATIVVVAVVVAAACVALGSWQLRRLHDRRELNARILARGSAAPVSIEGTSLPAGARAFARASATGTYDTEREVLVYGRDLNGQPGSDVVTPLLLPDGGAVLVLRGWVPFAIQEAPVAEATPPAGEVTVNGTILPDEGDGSNRPDENGVVRTVDVEGIASTVPYDVAPLPLRLTHQTPAQPGALPRPEPPPQLSEGPHLSYAIQWFSFATIALVGGLILVRRDRHATGSP